jgi:hypothetical protein
MGGDPLNFDRSSLYDFQLLRDLYEQQNGIKKDETFESLNDLDDLYGNIQAPSKGS